MRNRGRWTAVGVVALAVTLLVSGPGLGAPVRAAQSATRVTARSGYVPTEGAKFNVARGSVADQNRLVNQVIGAIQHAHSGTDIRLSMFSFDLMSVAKAIIAAKRRGVSVQVLVNDHETTHAQRVLRRRIGHDRSKKSWIYQCKNGCRSSGENLHTKFYIFSHTGLAKDVVMTGSTNMKENSAKNQYNDLWTRNDAPDLYAAFDDLFDHMKKDKIDKPGYWVQDIGSHFELQAMPKPGYTKTTDPIMQLLAPVKCHGATGKAGDNGRTVIRVMMHAWNADRGTWIAQRLRTLYADGCDVKAVYGFVGGNVRDVFHHATARGRVPIRSTGYDTDGDGELDLYTHQKNMTISGHYGSSTDTNLVVTGSSNWTVDGMRGDEEIFVINGTGAYPAYRTDFNWLWNNRTHSVNWAPTSGADYHPAPTGTAATTRTVTGRSMVGSGDDLKAAGPAWEGD